MAGNEIKPYGKREATKVTEANLQSFRGSTLANCKKYSADWWKVMSKWLKQAEDNEFKKLAVVEFNKLQIKALPSDIKIGADGEADVGVVILPVRRAAQEAKEAPVAMPARRDFQPLFSTATDTGVSSVPVEGEIVE